MMAQNSVTYPHDFSNRCSTLGSATLYEASGLNCAVDPLIRSISAGSFIAAPAYTVECSPGDNLGIHVAMDRIPRGSVLVVNASGFIAGYWGEVLTVAAEAAGVAGLIIDGGVRDIAAMRVRRFPVFTRGVSVRGTVKAIFPSVGKPVSIGGIQIATGDFIVADDDGVVAIPAEAIEKTIAAGEARMAKEATMMSRLTEGVKTLDLLGLEHWRTKA
jgi:4-hydroxy-4-methyl-2-oxoglutarate aldolase